ncbi:hypothetical protein [Mesorhizobium amorphae]|uniref:hypothetical protein n=1 Tax=Mesorhizobium amorphae TaxID=71433 RepID=UPI001181F0E0|nr:hypothetical protein [Mesorhizobium amorphae]
MSRMLRFTKTEIANAAKVAREQGVSVKLEADGSVLVFPAGESANSGDLLDRELVLFEAKHGYGGPARHS